MSLRYLCKQYIVGYINDCISLNEWMLGAHAQRKVHMPTIIIQTNLNTTAMSMHLQTA